MFGDETITREILGHVPSWLVIVFYGLTAVSCGWSAWSFRQRWRRHRQSRRPAARQPDPCRWERIRRGIRYLAFHEQLRRDPFSGWAHRLVFHGFLILFIGTCLVALEHDTPLHFFYGWFYQWASLIIDLGGLAFVIGLLMFLGRRMRQTSQRILREWWVAVLGVLLLAIGVSGFLLEGARIAVDFPQHERFSIVGYAIAQVLNALNINGEAAVRWYKWCWAGHAVLCVAFFALLPWGFFKHMIFGLVAATARSNRPLSRLPVLPLRSDLAPGAVSWRDFSPLDLLQSDACTTCGRCNEVCPAAAAGKPLQPRDVILELRRNQSESWSGVAPLALESDVLWSCTTCAACSHACPVGIDVYEKIVELRRGQVESGNVPNRAVDIFESILDRNNPFHKPDSERMTWASGLNVPIAKPGEPIEVLYWVGCAGSFSPEGRSVARAMTKILNHLGVDYRVLGTAERCTGDPARRMGEEGLFRVCAARNLRQFAEHGVRTVITHCAHCFNTFQNEYPAVDDGASAPRWRVQHHTQFLAEQIANSRLTAAASLAETVTFHDPCYLGRGNSVVDEPRSVLAGLNLPTVEMPRHGVDSFCCGAGGGSMWLDVRGSDRIENQRYQEAAASGATIIGTGCPFCKTMLEAARKSSSASNGLLRPRVMDVAELVVLAEGI